MSIEVTIDLSYVSAKLPLIALADVTLTFSEGKITVRRCPVFQKSGEPPWAALPRILIEKSGKKTYAPLIEMRRDLKKYVLDRVLTEFARQRDVRHRK